MTIEKSPVPDCRNRGMVFYSVGAVIFWTGQRVTAYRRMEKGAMAPRTEVKKVWKAHWRREGERTVWKGKDCWACSCQNCRVLNRWA